MVFPSKYDVIVVGAGPAGGTAAYFLGVAGKRVLVLEKASLPRYKPCGGAVSQEVLKQFPFSFASVIQTKVESISYACKGKTISIPLKDSSLCMVMRDEFDAYLIQHAPVEVHQGVVVRSVIESTDHVSVETTTDGHFEADYLIAADGANSVVAHSLNLRRKKILAGAIEIEAIVRPELLSRFTGRPLLIFGEIDVGYLWIFPKGNHLSVGIGALDPKPGELQSALTRVMRRLDISLDGQPRRGHPLPIYRGREPIQTMRAFLVGDAAGLVDPFTGEGIRFAIKSGRLAAEAILTGRPELYSLQVERQIGRSHRLGNVLTNWFYRLPELSFEVALRNPVLSRELMRMVADQIGYPGLLWQIAKSSPAYLVKKKPVMEFD